jgi:uncharacterized membrane protein HdeD (DUF308 family)
MRPDAGRGYRGEIEMTGVDSEVSRSGWLFVLFGALAIALGLFMIFRPGATVLAMVLVFGILALADGVVSLLTVFRKRIALPNGLLIVYALVSIAFGIVALTQPRAMAEALLWLLALWLIIAGIARIVFAALVRKVMNGEWLLALSGALAIALGILFLSRPGIGLTTIAMWVAASALFYGALQIFVGVRLLRARQRPAS